MSPWPGVRARSSLTDLGRPSNGSGSLEDLLDGLPTVLAAQSLKQLRDAIVAAHSQGRQVLAALGGHVIKTGCGPYLNDWIARGILTGVAMNGSAAIHDLELAIAGHTSEDVGPRLVAARSASPARRRTCLSRPAIGQPSGTLVWAPPWAKSSRSTAAPAWTPACWSLPCGMVFQRRSTWPSAPTSCT